MTAPHSAGTGYLGSRPASRVVTSSANKNRAGGWVATFDPRDLFPSDYEVYHISLKGPPGGFDVYIDETFYSSDSRSDKNEYDPNHAMYVRRGQTISFHFTSGANPRPEVNIFAREPVRMF